MTDYTQPNVDEEKEEGSQGQVPNPGQPTNPGGNPTPTPGFGDQGGDTGDTPGTNAPEAPEEDTDEPQ